MIFFLRFSASGLCVECVQELLKHGAEVNHQTFSLDTALHNAAEHGKTDILACLLTHGADLTTKNELGLTPLYITCHRNEVDCLLELIKHAESKGTCRPAGSFTTYSILMSLN